MELAGGGWDDIIFRKKKSFKKGRQEVNLEKVSGEGEGQ